MSMRNLKVGDLVTAGDKYQGHWKNCTVVEVSSTYVRAINQEGVVGLFYMSHNELTKVDVNLTDQELADKYRALRKEATDIGQQLIDRGYKSEVMLAPNGVWNRLGFHNRANYRFTKTETKTIIL